MSEHTYDIFSIKVIIGLGNPGSGYYKTRHSIGFRIVDAMVDYYHGSWVRRDNMSYTQVNVSNEEGDYKQIYIVKPETYMNSSGNVLPFFIKKGIKAEEILVVHDELEKTFGKVAIRFGGSARGHNGLRSIIDRIGKDFWRLRFGIGRPEDRADVANYVLKPFSIDEEEALDAYIEKAFQMILKGP